MLNFSITKYLFVLREGVGYTKEVYAKQKYAVCVSGAHWEGGGGGGKLKLFK